MLTTGTEIRFHNIVIVEDDEDISDTIRYNLEREGFRVRAATTGEDALDIIFDAPPIDNTRSSDYFTAS